ncbi:FtsX-like permease family protein [Algoriphagus sp. D3-2-R+10]|uniref:ABC transporter permease n=1 Tax=Algoriphagus aurantiacus TaxID=3103948 RepID=UPI002B3EEB81|nr:FtsX-like permease family protein [Algoriphagus sp. D3-2-R+10]MEB2776622.1 FtsX-like permease family protein [Algoriphagus sp. D3-2-R+10]
MINNYLKTAVRILRRERTNSIINIAGLMLGITGSLILFLIVHNGSNYDSYHKNKDKIYRVVTSEKTSNGESFTQGIPPILVSAFREDFESEVKAATFTSYRRNSLVGFAKTDGSFSKVEMPQGLAYAEPSFFEIFDRDLLTGDYASIEDPNTALISSKWAKEYFKEKDPVGELIKYDEELYKITGIMQDYPAKTDLPIDLMLSYATIKKQKESSQWGGISDSDNCYFLLNENASIENLEAQLPGFTNKYYGEKEANGFGKNFIAQPLNTLHSDMRFGNYGSKMPFIAKITFLVIGLVLLVSCCINFINLTTAAAVKRNKEIGIRKILGSSRTQLISQLLSETFLITFIATGLSIIFGEFLLKFINPYLGLDLSFNLGSEYIAWIYLIGVMILVTVLSGLYPAWIISSGKGGKVYSSNSFEKKSGFSVRSSLVVVQFFISQFFIIATLVMYSQFSYMQNKDIGFQKEAIVTLPIPVNEQTDTIQNESVMRTLKAELQRLPGISMVSLNNAPPSSNSVLGTSFSIPGKDEPISTQIKEVDGDYIALFELELLAGTGLSDLDTMSGFVVNETLAKQAGFEDYNDLVGEQIDLWGNKMPVKGVVKDFNSTSLSKPVEPVILLNNLSGFHSIALKIEGNSFEQNLTQVQSKWEAAYPEYIFSYSFLDDQIFNMYNGERKTSTVLALFSSLAIFIGCLGLFGLVTFMANNKTKEIGIRKVLGASSQSIVLLFSREFSKLILIGFAIATPIAAFVMRMVLKEFAYQISLGPAIFLIGLGITFVIAFITVGFRSLGAAMANPVDSLRSE